MLEIKQLIREFGGLRAVDSVSFTLQANTITGLIGPNGAGKTTLFNTIAGLHKPTSGQITFLGKNIGGLPPHRIYRAGLARTFQIPRPFAAMTVLENSMLAPAGQAGEYFWNNWFNRPKVRTEERACRDRAQEILAFLGLDGLAGEYARNLSGGQQKLLELARVLTPAPSSSCWMSLAQASTRACWFLSWTS